MEISQVGGSSTGGEIARATQQVLGKDDFLKLLMTQLRFQDALEPVKDKDFIAQMAQFSALEQSTNMADSFAKFAAKAGNNEALSMLGTRAEVVDVETGEPFEGVVTSIKYEKEEPQITLTGLDGKIKVVGLSAVSRVSIV